MYQNMVCFTNSNIQYSLNCLNASFLSGPSARAEPKKHPKWIIRLSPDLLVLFWLVGWFGVFVILFLPITEV